MRRVFAVLAAPLLWLAAFALPIAWWSTDLHPVLQMASPPDLWLLAMLAFAGMGTQLFFDGGPLPGPKLVLRFFGWSMAGGVWLLHIDPGGSYSLFELQAWVVYWVVAVAAAIAALPLLPGLPGLARRPTADGSSASTLTAAP